MRPFERLLTGSEADLAQLFARFPIDRKKDPDRIQDDIAQQMGLNRSQLICGCGFNRNIAQLPRVLNVLGFSSFDAVWGQRNFIFINDVYRLLTIDNVLEIYAQVGRDQGPDDVIPDLIGSRLNNLEAQIEATINPIMLGGYKLEIRAIYDNHLVSRDLVDSRLAPGYAVLRGLSNEVSLMVSAGLITPAEVLRHAGATAQEKARLLYDHLVDRNQVIEYLRGESVPVVERRVLEQALSRNRMV